VLFAAYAATLGLPAFGSSDYAGDEPHYLLIAESIVSDGDIDLTDEYRTRAYRDFYPLELEVHGQPTGNRIHEPHGVGFPLLIAPAYALAGPVGVELFLAAIAALAFALGARLARHLAPEPWATAAVLVVGLSPPALAYGTAVYPELAAGALLAGAALAALRLRSEPRVRTAALAGGLLAALPWLGPKFLVPGAVVLFFAVRWLLRRQRGTAALVAAEIPLASIVFFVSINERLFGGLTPYAASAPGESATGATGAAGYLERIPRLAALWLDRDYGLLRWAPVLALAGFAVWLLWRSRRDRVARIAPERAGAEAAAALLAGVCGAQILVAAFLSPTMFGFWFPGRHLVCVLPALAALCAWGLQRAPRTGAVLSAITLIGSGWFYAELRLGGGGLVAPGWSAPWGPLEVLWPRYGTGSLWADVSLGLVAVALAALVAFEWRHWRSTAGTTRRAYSG
jgi:hypothetical protein